MTSGTVKRLRVRLKAQTDAELAESFGPFLSGDGVFVIGDPSLPDHTRVLFQLLFADGVVALEGKGHVLGRRGDDPGPPGLIIGLEWSSDSRARLDRLLGHEPIKSDPVPVPVPVPVPILKAPVPVPVPIPSAPPPTDLIDETGGFEDEPLDEDLAITELPQSLSSPDLISDLVGAMPLPVTPPPLAATPVLSESEAPGDRFAFGDDVRARLRGAPSTEYRYSSEDVWSDDVSGEYDMSGHEHLRAPGEVTPLARLELVRKYTPAFQTGDLEPLSSGPASSAIPSKKQRPELEKKTGRTFAVDLGHSMTRMAGPTLMGPATLPFRSGADAIPSAVLIEPEGRTWVGEHAASRVLRNHRHTIYGTTRLIGRTHASPLIAALDDGWTAPLTAAEESETAVRIGSYTVSFEETAALILKEAKESASVAMGEPVNRVVLTVPASYGQRQRAGFSVAGLLAGLHVEAVVGAPLAAAYGLLSRQLLPAGRVLLIDMGGGFLDTVVCEVDDAMVGALASSGDATLGGHELDVALAAPLIEALVASEGPAAQQDPLAMLSILRSSELAKWTLAEHESARMRFDRRASEMAPAREVEVQLDRQAALSLLAPLFERIKAVIAEVLLRSATPASGLSAVVLLGAQAQWPLLRESLVGAFNCPIVSRDFDTAQVLGAAALAGLIDQGQALPLVEILPESVGVGRLGGGLSTVIPRGTPLIARGRHVFRVERDEDLELFLFQGDTGSIAGDEPLARLRLIEAPTPMPRPYEVALELELGPGGPVSAHAQHVASGAAIEVVDVPEITRELITLRHVGAASERSESGLLSRLFKKLRGQPNAS